MGYTNIAINDTVLQRFEKFREYKTKDPRTGEPRQKVSWNRSLSKLLDEVELCRKK